MRVSTASILALPLLVAAQQNPLDQIQEQAQFYFQKIQSYFPSIPNPSAEYVPHVHAAAAKAGGKKIDILTLSNWKETMQSSYTAASKGPEEWWVLITGGNRTCFGLCGNIETAFNESALAFASLPTGPHMGYLNCDQQPVLCNSWAAGPPVVWMFQVGEVGKPVDIQIQRLNTTTTTAKSFLNLHQSKRYRNLPKYEGYFHPFNGQLAEYGLATPLGYLLWVFSLVPNWMFMIGVSFASRSMMGRRHAQDAARPAPAA